MTSIFTPNQTDNIRRGYHPDCCLAEPCPACGATEAPGSVKGCLDRIKGLPRELWVAAARIDHNADPDQVLHVSGSQLDAKLMDLAAREIIRHKIDDELASFLESI